jgi:uncharacterized membrane protein HdeD (DUF308 family)
MEALAMSTTDPNESMLIVDLSNEELNGIWQWLALVGIALVAAGVVALGAVVIASLATAAATGMLLLAGGTAEVAGAFWCRRWSGFSLHMTCGVLSVVVGAMFLSVPVGALQAGALLSLTLLLACLLIAGGVLKIVAAQVHRFEGWVWPLASGIVDLALGILIWRGWPVSALWVIAVFAGINLVFRGVNWIGLGLALRPTSPASAGTAATAPTAP